MFDPKHFALSPHKSSVMRRMLAVVLVFELLVDTHNGILRKNVRYPHDELRRSSTADGD